MQNLKIEKYKEIVIIQLIGNWFYSENLQACIKNLQQENIYKLIIDFRNTTHISSQTLGLLLDYQMTCQSKKGDITCIIEGSEIANLFCTMHPIIKVFRSIEKATLFFEDPDY